VGRLYGVGVGPVGRSGLDRVESWGGAGRAQHFQGRVRGHGWLVGYAEPTLIKKLDQEGKSHTHRHCLELALKAHTTH
jgi:hypothetical protein